MKIEASDTEIAKLLKGGFLVIPRFQRPYSWKNDNLRDFWTDVTEADEGSYFIGSMVIYDMGQEKFGVVDGQQRLTTVTIILCCIRDKLKELGENDLAQGIHNYIETSDRNNIKSFVLKTETSFPYLQEEIQKFGDPELRVEPGEEELRLKAGYDYFIRQIDDYIKKQANGLLDKSEKKERYITTLKELRDVILQLKVIKIELSNEEEAYVIFETLNTRGQDLTLSDLIKNTLGSLVEKQGDVDVFKELWKKITSCISDAGPSAKTDTFFVHSWSSRFTPVTKAKAFKAIKDRLHSSIEMAGEDQARSIAISHLRALSSDASRYSKIYEPSRGWAKYQYSVADSLRALRLFSVEQQTTFVLSLVRAYDEKKIAYRTLRRTLTSVENFHFLFNAITSSRSSGSIAAMYSKAAKGLYDATDSNGAGVAIRDLLLDLTKRKPKLEEFKLSFSDLSYSQGIKSNALIKYVLTRLLSHEKLTVDVDISRLTIEHIIPQASIGREHTAEAVNNIGNLFLLSESRNALVAEKSFLQKKQYFNQWQNSVPKIIRDSEDWTPERIKIRADSMAEAAYKEVWRV